jgi:hypothetical protein
LGSTVPFIAHLPYTVQTYTPITYTLQCGVTLEIDYVPGALARRRAHANEISPEPNKPTRKIETGPNIFSEEEYEDAEWLKAKRHYDREIFPYLFRGAILEMGVVGGATIDQTRLEQRRKRLGGFGAGDLSDYLMLCLLADIDTNGASELDRLCAKILENDLGWAEVSKSGEGAGS